MHHLTTRWMPAFWTRADYNLSPASHAPGSRQPLAPRAGSERQHPRGPTMAIMGEVDR
jgi:hypothetical protein